MRLKEEAKIVIYPIIGNITKVVFGVFPLKKKIIFSAFSGKRYGDNPKYISEKLHELYPQYEQVWVQYKGYTLDCPDYVKVVKFGSFKMFFEACTSKIWIDSHMKRLWWPRKRKKQYYIETWHGGLGFKKIESDVADRLSKLEIVTNKNNMQMVDLLISNSKWLSSLYKRAFWNYSGQILECGYPKADILYKNNEELIKKLKEKLNLQNKKVVLYAPTFRESEDTSIYKFNYKRILDTLEQKFGGSWVMLIRLHPLLIKQSEDIIETSSNIVINVTDYPDMQELILLSDLFLTDYSSGIFDFAILRRPAFLYAPDLDEYIKYERGVYMDLRSLPFPFACDEKELVSQIVSFKKDEYLDELNRFFTKTGLIETPESAETICKKIYEIMEG